MAWKQGPKSKYAEQLLDPRWQKKRLEILARDEWTCQVCGAKEKTLHVHHAIYNPSGDGPWDAGNGVLYTVCADCHAQEHEYLPDSHHSLLDLIGGMGIRGSRDITAFVNLEFDHAEARYKAGSMADDERLECFVMALREFGKVKAKSIADGKWFLD